MRKHVLPSSRRHWMAPPCASATCRATARPRPTPSRLPVTNGSNSRAATSAAGPDPVSHMFTPTRPGGAGAAATSTRPPGPAASMALVSSTTNTWLNWPPSPLRLLPRLRPLRQPPGHVVDAARQVAQLVVAARQRHRAEVAAGDEPRPPLQFADAPAQALADGHRQDERRQPAEHAEHERR